MSSLSRDFIESLLVLRDKGIRYSTCIDVGCADGSFFLHMHSLGVFKSTVPMNVDANTLYEPSLRQIKDVLLGDFAICAVSDHDGEIELVMSNNPYWSSVRTEDDLYWKRINGSMQSKVAVPALTLDSLAAKYRLK